jgi:UDP-N-acetylmuramoyl-tripeptide--D-alanyl-D-alanine ligase
MEKLFDLFYQSTGVSTDTRNIKQNSLFICLSGEKFNGNTFAKQALELGAKFVIADDQSICDEKTIFYVNNCLVFLQKLANYHRNKFNIPVIGITGSNGKTSTKELINCVLSKKYKTLATIGNLNNHIGVPLTLLRLTGEDEIAIIEMGANKFKDIEELCQIAEPNFGIITNIGKAHLEGFLNFEGVLKTKKELYDAVSIKNGTLFYNSDDEILCNNLPKNTNSISFGTKKEATISGQLVALNPFIKLKWKSTDFQSGEIQTSMIGKYNFYNFLAAISIGHFFNVENEKICDAIQNYESTNNRSQIKKTATNTLILDAYNANPSSMSSAIESFNLIEHAQKIAILGDMFELGADSSSEHEKIIATIKKIHQPSFFIGERFYEFYQQEDALISFFKNKEDFKLYLENNAISDKLILLKGSRGIGLEELVEKL